MVFTAYHDIPPDFFFSLPHPPCVWVQGPPSPLAPCQGCSLPYFKSASVQDERDNRPSIRNAERDHNFSLYLFLFELFFLFLIVIEIFQGTSIGLGLRQRYGYFLFLFEESFLRFRLICVVQQRFPTMSRGGSFGGSRNNRDLPQKYIFCSIC